MLTRRFISIARTSTWMLLAITVIVALHDRPVRAGQDSRNASPESRIERIETLRTALLDTAPGSGQRAELLRQLLESRRALISNHPNDKRVALWQADLAFDLLFITAQENALDLMVEFGVPSDADRRTLRSIADEAFASAERAQAGLADLILELEEDPDFVQDVGLQMERRRIVSEEQEQRIPFLLLQARSVQIAAGMPAPIVSITVQDQNGDNGSPRRSLAPLSNSTLDRYRSEVIQQGEVIALLLDEPWRSHAYVALGMAKAQIGDHAQVERSLREVLEINEENSTMRFRAWAALSRTRAHESGPGEALLLLQRELVDESWIADDPFWMLLASDVQFRLRLEYIAALARGERPSNKPGLPRRFPDDEIKWKWLIEAYTPFLEREYIQVDRPARVRLVGDRVSRVIPAGVQGARLPAIVRLAQAQSALQNPESTTQARDLLTQLLSDADAPDWVRSRASLLLSAVELQAGDDLDAAEHFLLFAKQFPDSPDAATALEQAISVLVRWERARIERQETPHPNATEATDEITLRFEELMRDATRFMFNAFRGISHFDTWAYEFGEFEARRGRHDAAVHAFSQIELRDALHVEARYRIAELMRQKALETADQADDEDQKRTADSAWNESVEAAESAMIAGHRAIREATGSNDERVTRWRVIIAASETYAADGYLRLGNARESLRVLGPYKVEQEQMESAIPETLIAERLRIRIEALELLGHSAEADQVLRDLARQSPDRALPVIHRIVSSVYQDVSEMEQYGREEQAAAEARTRLHPLALLLASILDDITQPDSSALGAEQIRSIRFHIAESHRFIGEYQRAFDLFSELKSDESLSLEVSLASAECAFHLQRDEDAMREYRRVNQHVRAQPNWMFWLTELRMLEILDRLGRNTDKIFPRIQRLRRTDPELGGPRFAEALAALEAKYAP